MIAIDIRRAGLVDAAPVSRLLAEIWHATHDAVLGEDRVAAITARWHAPDALAAQIVDPRCAFLVARAGDGRLVGHALSRHVTEGSERVDLMRLYVRPALHGSRLGKRLMDEAIAAQPTGLAVRLEVQDENPRAIRFYTREGFVRIGHTATCGGGMTDVPALILERAPTGRERAPTG